MSLTRRNLGLGAAALAGLAVITVGYRKMVGRWYASTPYDDLLDQLVDREPAIVLGKAALKTMPHVNAASLGAQLRQPGFDLQRRARGDGAANRVVNVQGWVLPESVVRYAALAASV